MPELRDRLRASFRWVGDRNDPDYYADVTGWWRDASIVDELGGALTDLHGESGPTVVIGTQSRGSLLGLRRSLLWSGDRVLFVDDWIATGAQAEAARRLVEMSGAAWIGASVVVDGLERSAIRRHLNLRSLFHIRDL